MNFYQCDSCAEVFQRPYDDNTISKCRECTTKSEWERRWKRHYDSLDNMNGRMRRLPTNKKGTSARAKRAKAETPLIKSTEKPMCEGEGDCCCEQCTYEGVECRACEDTGELVDGTRCHTCATRAHK